MRGSLAQLTRRQVARAIVIGAKTVENGAPRRDERMAELPARESMEFDVVIVGAGPAGPRRRDPAQAARARHRRRRGREGLGGRRPYPLRRGDRSDRPRPPVARLARRRTRPSRPRSPTTASIGCQRGGAIRLPNFLMPPLMTNHGNFVVSLGNVCRWLAQQGRGARRRDLSGLCRRRSAVRRQTAPWSASPPATWASARTASTSRQFTRGMELRGKYTLFAEGARGSLAKQLIAQLRARRRPRAAEIRHRPEGALAGRARASTSPAWCSTPSAGRSTIRPAAARSSTTSKTIWCRSASSSTSTTRTPISSPFEEFQRFKTHPLIRATFEGGKRLAYGARAITEGGWQSVPKLIFPGGALIGCAAGFVNVPRIKGSHNAMLSGMLAAEAVAAALAAGRAHDELADYEDGWRGIRHRPRPWSGAQRQAAVVELRHVRSASALGGLDMWTNTLRLLAVRHAAARQARFATLEPAAKHADRLSEARRRAHLRPALLGVPVQHQSRGGPAGRTSGADMALQKSSEHDVYAGPSARYCPAGVYEWVEEAARPALRINAQNCVHCKTCDIKDPNQNITWVPPEGGGGPNYPNM